MKTVALLLLCSFSAHAGPGQGARALKNSAEQVRDQNVHSVILGGSEVKPGAEVDDRFLMYTVRLSIQGIVFTNESRTKVAKKTSEGICTGSVLTRHHVLTAAHCYKMYNEALEELAEGRPHELRYVAHFSSSGNRADAEQVAVKQVLPHPVYTGEAWFSGFRKGHKSQDAFDLMVVRLDQPVPLGFEPVTIARAEAPDEGELVQVVGWGQAQKGSGASSQLKSAEFEAENVSTYSYQIKLPSGTNKAIGHGDSGGPHFVFRGPTPQQVGVTAYGRGEGEEFYTGGGTFYNPRLVYYLDFLREAVKKSSADLPASEVEIKIDSRTNTGEKI